MGTIADWLPEYEFGERHRTVVWARPEVVDRELRSVTLGELPVARMLFALRAVPARRRGGERIRANPHRPLIDEMRDGGFVVLEDARPAELLLGTAGRLGRPTVLVEHGPRAPEEFRAYDRADACKAVIDFRIQRRDDGSCLLSTETRVHALGPEAERRFRRYWLVIRPFSGLIRLLVLRAVKRRAEAYDRGA